MLWCWLGRVGWTITPRDRLLLVAVGPCLVEIWVNREMASWKDAANDCAAVFRLTGA